ncbi:MULTISPECIES: acyltransferase family protein [unclassified Kaistella]|uniref:acyltransferase family protein n=1 Tax=unclassified Kaistella TaxID=2762626 RepID=UPI002735BDEA|nr:MULTISPECIES: acyltransferase family protein [unclassified Kaistella]MDP2452516.1 acyltransferase family protein [Kaistella sp. SH11-4b]MDP2455424.1 acyltransferase family protein [Kaistella sp. SH40-3]MDP2458328.1 acyltransferase family protein [Kaistella sp. SH19-2b]
MQFRNDIQGLRAIAFFLVFVFHLNKEWLPGGFLGVDLFFVISGYLVSSIILHEIKHHKFDFINFFIKRIKRIVPAYLFMLFAVAFASLYFYLFLDMGTIRGTLLRSLLFVSNQVFAGGSNYFGASMSENPLLHTWSLAIEMQFYLILPLILYFFRKKLFLVLIGMILLLSAYSTFQILHHHQNEMYFSLLARIPEFLVGALFSVLFKEGINFSRQINNILAVGCCVVFLACTAIITENSAFPGFLALIPTLAAAVLLSVRNNVMGELLGSKWLVHFGQLSYSLYLFHWPVMAVIRYRFDEYLFDLKTILFISVLTYVLSWVSYSFVESKFRKQNDTLFFKTLISSSFLFLVLCGFMPKISEQNKIPASFSSPAVGLKSHNQNSVEKLGDLSRNDSIVLIGDSHALSLKPFFNEIGRKNHFSFFTLTRNTYPAIKGIKKSDIPLEKQDKIEETNILTATTERLIAENKIIIINSIGFERLPSLTSALYSLADQIKADQKLILISTFPIVDKNPIKLNNGFKKVNSYHFIKTNNEKNRMLLHDVAKRYPNVFVYDVAKSKIFDNAPYINDTVAYFDGLHLNQFGALKLSKDLEKDFMKFLTEIKDK